MVVVANISTFVVVFVYFSGAVSKLAWDESGQTLAVGSSRGSVTLFSQKSIQEDIKRDKTLVLHEVAHTTLTPMLNPNSHNYP